MLNALEKPFDRNLIIAAASVLLLSIFGGLISEEPAVYLAPVGFLIAFQLLTDYRPVFYLLLISTPFSIEYYFDNGFSTNLPTEPLMIILMFTFLFYILLNKDAVDRKFLTHPITIIIFIHYVWMIIATIYSQDIFISTKYMLAKTWYIVPFYFITSLLIKNPVDFKKVFWCLFIPTLIVVLYTLNNHMHYQFRFSEVNKTMVPFFRNHVNYAVFIALMLPFLFIASSWYPKNSWKRLLINLSKVIFLVAIYFSYTRSAWLSVAIAMGAYFVIRYHLLYYGIIAAIAGVLVFITYMYTNNHFLKYAPDYSKTIYHSELSAHMESTLTLEDVSSAERIYRWVAAVNMIKDKPLIGFGPEEFYDNYKDYTINKFETYISDNEEHSTVHNYYLQVTVEQGIPGLIIWMTLLISVLVTGQSMYKRATDQQDKLFVMVLLLSFITILVNISLSDLIEADKIGTLFFMNIAMLVNMDIRIRRKQVSDQIS